VGLVALDLPVGAALLAAALLPMALTVELIILGVSGLFGLGDYDYVGPLTLNPAAGVLLLVLALAAAVVTIAILGALRLAVRAYTRAVLGRRGGQEGPIRELLAERVGDRTLSIAYWLSDREEFVDEMGREVQLPTPARGARGPRSSTTARAWRRSSTTPSSTPRPSSSTPPRPPRRSRSTTSG
jgi:hypothetical protein